MPLREDDVAARTGVPDRRILVQVGGFLLAVAATLAVFLTDNPQVLKLAVVGVAWAFVIATFAAASRSTERIAARAREAELRHAYENELDREISARREYELELEVELRREAEESMRAELDALRDDLAGLTELRTDVAALSALRDEVARVAALRDDVAALASLRQELGQLTGLRDDMGRLRQELTEQLSSEMLVERIVMRTQASRLTSDVQNAPGRAFESTTRWSEDSPPRELTGGWPAVRLDEPRETRQFDQVRVERAPARRPVPPLPPAPARPVPSPSWRPSWESEPERPRPWDTPPTATWETLSTPSWESPPTAAWSSAAPPGRVDADEDTPLWSAARSDLAGHARHGAAEPPPPTAAFPMAPPASAPPEPLPSPMEWLAARSLLEAEPTSFRPEVPPRRRRGDEAHADVVAPDPERSAPPAQEKRLADILAENGGTASVGRRRRRYRDEDEPDDVLARVLRNG